MRDPVWWVTVVLQALVVGWLVALVDAWWKLQRILLELRRDVGELLAEVSQARSQVNDLLSDDSSEIATPPQTPPLSDAEDSGLG